MDVAWNYAKNWFSWSWKRMRNGYLYGDVDDAKQELWLALHYTFKSYDPSKGPQKTYAKYAIARAKINLMSRSTGLGRNLCGKNAMVYKADIKLRSELGREPTIKEISAEAGVLVESVQMLQWVASRADWFSKDRLEAQGDWEAQDEALQILPDVENYLDTVKIREAIGNLGDRYQSVLKLYYDEENTLDECGEWFGLSSERIRQIKLEAIRLVRDAFSESTARHKRLARVFEHRIDK